MFLRLPVDVAEPAFAAMLLSGFAVRLAPSRSSHPPVHQQVCPSRDQITTRKIGAVGARWLANYRRL